MDLHVAVFLLIFLCISSLTTLVICFVELRSCWRNYRNREGIEEAKATTAELAKAMGVDQAELEAAVCSSELITDSFQNASNENCGLEPDFGEHRLDGATAMESMDYDGYVNHDLDYHHNLDMDLKVAPVTTTNVIVDERRNMIFDGRSTRSSFLRQGSVPL